MKILMWIVGIVILLIGGFYVLNSYIYNEKQASGTLDYQDAEYVLDGQRIRLVDGVSEVEVAPNSASKVVTKYFGNDAKGDLNSDGIPDLAFLLTQNSGGSGTFYYLVAAIQNTSGGYEGTSGVMLGDRIAPQTTEIRDGRVIVNYADRAPGESFVTLPSVGKSIWLKLDVESMQFGEIVQDFEREADPSRMMLGMKKWNWINALYNDGRNVTPKQPEKFTLTLSPDGKFSATTDCNGMSGSYTTNKSDISFGAIASTKMYCEGSDESEFSSILLNAQGYHFTSRGEFVIDLKFDSGSAVFR